MKKIMKKILTNKSVRNIAVIEALSLAVLVAGEPWMAAA
jgi:hypothetical protein